MSIEFKREIRTEGLQTITINGKLEAVCWKDMECKHNVWFRVEEIGMDEMAELFKKIAGVETPKENEKNKI